MNISCTVLCEFTRNYKFYRPYLILYVKCFCYLIVLNNYAIFGNYFGTAV